MNSETLYWILSTIAQVNAALIAFVGFLALSVLNTLNSGREEMKELCIRNIIDHNISEFRTALEQIGLTELFPQRNETYYRSMPPDEFMNRLIKAQEKGKELAAADYMIGTLEKITGESKFSYLTYPLFRWRSLTARRQGLSRNLVDYLGLNLAILLFSLISIPLVPIVVVIPGLIWVLVVVSFSIALSTAIMVYQTVLGPNS